MDGTIILGSIVFLQFAAAIAFLKLISAKKEKSEAALRKSESRLAETQRIAHLGSWEWNIKTNELQWSDETHRIFGLVPQQLGATYEVFLSSVHPDDRQSVQEAVNKALHENTPYSIDHRIVLPDGTERNVQEQAEVTFDADGKPARMIGTVHDITEVKLLEEKLLQSQKMEAIGRLAGGIAHDFNNLLMPILGYDEFLILSIDPEDSRHHYAMEIHKAATRAADLTKQLLAFSRSQVLEPKVIDLNTVVTNLEKMLKRMIGEDIDLVTVLDTGLGRVKADPGQIEQVIMNLAVNSRDAMPDGGKLTIEAENVALDRTYAYRHVPLEPGSYVMLAVSDTGVGIDKKILPRIFEPFFTTKAQGKGTGLGLSTAYGIIKQSGGYIWAYSEPGCGTTFKIYLPRVEDPLDRIKLPISEALSARGGETILLVEDEEMVRTLIGESLRESGYTVLETSQGQEALAVCEKREEPIDLVITDLIMPGMNGWELAKRVMSLRPEAKALFISGYTENSVMGNGIMESGAAFLPKPFSPRTLSGKVREVLGGASHF